MTRHSAPPTPVHDPPDTDQSGTDQRRPGALPRWRTVNITPAERAGRIVIGLAAVIGGIVLLTGVTSVLAAVLAVLLVLAGLDLIVTGALGHCPLYARLGHVPRSLRSRP
jgi:Inner membrane protein YgaP-like, transmembrane domain